MTTVTFLTSETAPSKE